MKFKRGSKVEVLSNKDPLGAWRCAEIVEDNADGYTVRYFRCPGTAKDRVNRVSAEETIRPCPRQLSAVNNWGVGDVVEVLDDGFWRVSVIEDVMGDDCYYIRVIGSLDEFKVENSGIRARQEWREDKFILINKDSENYWDLTSRMRKNSSVQQQRNPLKRSPPGFGATDEAYSKSVKKQRLLNQEVVVDAIHGDCYSFIGKVDNSANQRGIGVKDDVQIFTKIPINSNQATNGNHSGFSLLARTFDDDCVSTMSSVASCSFVNAISDRLVSTFSASCSEDSDSLCSDAESHSYLRAEDGVSYGQLEGSGSVNEHELDLHSYRCILQSLYLSGPLSWLQEIALTNLRMRLCVTNDEHLMELRRLKSLES